jgi:hypothetical protein
MQAARSLARKKMASSPRNMNHCPASVTQLLSFFFKFLVVGWDTNWPIVPAPADRRACSTNWHYSRNMNRTKSRNNDWLLAGRPRDRSSSLGRVENFLFSTSSRPTLWFTQPPIQWVPGVKRPRREAVHSPPASAEVKNIHSNAGIVGSYLLCAFVLFCVQVAPFRRAQPPSNESYRNWKGGQGPAKGCTVVVIIIIYPLHHPC